MDNKSYFDTRAFITQIFEDMHINVIGIMFQTLEKSPITLRKDIYSR